MNRRQFLAALAAVPLMVKALPELSAAEATLPAQPFDWFGAREWRVAFPDGTVWAFDGVVESIVHCDVKDGLRLTDMKVRPMGPMRLSEITHVSAAEAKQAVPANGAMLSSNGVPLGELTEIEPPSYEREMIDVTQGDDYSVYMPGLKRMGSISFTLSGEWK